mgnify:CR=1 FL=1
MLWKIKRWWLFRLAPCPKVGDAMVFYPFDSKDTLRQELVVKGIKGECILFTYVGYTQVTEMCYEDFFELYINKKFIESKGIKL